MNRLTGAVPPWAVGAALVVVLAVVILMGRSAMAGSDPDAGPPKKVYPGMYDLRAEAAKALSAQSRASTTAGGPNGR